MRLVRLAVCLLPAFLPEHVGPALPPPCWRKAAFLCSKPRIPRAAARLQGSANIESVKLSKRLHSTPCVVLASKAS